MAAVFSEHAGRIRYVTIVPEAKSHGHLATWGRPRLWRAINEGDNRPLTRMRLEDEVIVLLSGGLAERRAGNRQGARWGRWTDHEHAADLLFTLSGSERQANAMLRWLHVVAEELLALLASSAGGRRGAPRAQDARPGAGSAARLRVASSGDGSPALRRSRRRRDGAAGGVRSGLLQHRPPDVAAALEVRTRATTTSTDTPSRVAMTSGVAIVPSRRNPSTAVCASVRSSSTPTSLPEPRSRRQRVAAHCAGPQHRAEAPAVHTLAAAARAEAVGALSGVTRCCTPQFH